ncbi:MAG: hypothetical protein KC589_01430 [Nanoarchaeota archaeon]|nr:hypothetical protein [Nanoarchaeota archaeon]
MKFKKILWIATLTLVLLVLFTLASSKIFEIDFTTAQNASVSFWFIVLILSTVFGAVFTHFYFKDKNVIPSAKEGFILAISIIIISFMIEFIFIIIYTMFVSKPYDFVSYYFEPLFWASVLLFVISSSVYGFINEGKERNIPIKTKSSTVKKKDKKPSKKTKKTKKK